MSTSLSIDFQLKMQQRLQSDLIISDKVKNIHQSLKHSGKYPYIYHRINNIKLYNASFVNTYEIQGEVNIYYRDTSLIDIKILVKQVESIISNFSETTLSFKYISGRAVEADFSNSHDHITSRVQILFLCLLQERALSVS
jgi:hypothetical protein